MKDPYEKEVTIFRNNRSGRGRSVDERASFAIALYLEPRDVENEPERRWRVIRTQTWEQDYVERITDVLAYVSAKSGVSSPC